MLKLNCPGCDKIVDAPEKLAGKKVQCPFCKQVMRVPSLEPAAPVERDSSPVREPPREVALAPPPSGPPQQKRPTPPPATPKVEKAPQPSPTEDEYGLAPLGDEDRKPSRPAAQALKPLPPPEKKQEWSLSNSPAAGPTAPAAGPAASGLAPLAPLDDLFDERSFPTAKPLPAGPAPGFAPAPAPVSSPYAAPSPYAPGPMQPQYAYAGGPQGMAMGPAYPMAPPANNSGTIAMVLGIFSILIGFLAVIVFCIPLVATAVPLLGLILGGSGLYIARPNGNNMIVPGIGTALNGIMFAYQMVMTVYILVMIGSAVVDARNKQGMPGGGDLRGIEDRVTVELCEATVISDDRVRFRLRLTNRGPQTIGSVNLDGVWIHEGQNLPQGLLSFTFPGGLPPGGTGEATLEDLIWVGGHEKLSRGRFRLLGITTASDPHGRLIGTRRNPIEWPPL